MKATVNTFDVFDTLLARYCVEPIEVLRLIERKNLIPDFTKRRQQAQRRLDERQRPYVIHEIYAELERHGVASELAERLLKLELLTEQRQYVPIRRWLDQVTDQDVLVSDTYLPAEFIYRNLIDAGLKTRPRLVASNWGKHSGTMWRALREHLNVRVHFGDNPLSDIRRPNETGIAGQLVEDSRLWSDETEWLSNGLSDLALARRETRLRTVAAADQFSELVLCHYLPLLALMSVRIGRTARQLKSPGVALVSRDCVHLSVIFTQFFPQMPTVLVDANRRTLADPGHAHFFRERFKNDWLVVDLVSSGRSLGKWLLQHGTPRPVQILYFLDEFLQVLPHLPREKIANLIQPVARQSELKRFPWPLEVLFDPGYEAAETIVFDAASGGSLVLSGPSHATGAERQRISWVGEAVATFAQVCRNRGLRLQLDDDELNRRLRLHLDTILAADWLTKLFPTHVAREQFDPPLPIDSRSRDRASD